MADALIYPADKSTDGAKLQYALTVQEQARRVHNVMGMWCTKGIKKAEYDALPESVRAAFKYSEKPLPLESFRAFQDKLYRKWSDAVIADILTMKEKARAEETISLDLDAVVK